MYRTNTLRNPPTVLFLHSAFFLEQLKVKKDSCKHLPLHRVTSGGQTCCICATYTRAFLPASPSDGDHGDSGGYPDPAVGLGGGGPRPGLLLGGNAPLGFRESRWEVPPCCPRALVPKRRGNDAGGTKFQILLITATDL